MPQTDVFLNAGDFFFHRPDASLTAPANPLTARTLLGSCVSILLWQPAEGIGGMCHCVLPGQSSRLGAFDANHCEGAVRLFQRELARLAMPPAQFKVFLLGGSRMTLGLRQLDRVSVGERNIEASRQLLGAAGFTITAEHVGQTGPRRVRFNLGSGEVEVTHNNRTLNLTERTARDSRFP